MRIVFSDLIWTLCKRRRYRLCVRILQLKYLYSFQYMYLFFSKIYLCTSVNIKIFLWFGKKMYFLKNNIRSEYFVNYNGLDGLIFFGYLKFPKTLKFILFGNSIIFCSFNYLKTHLFIYFFSFTISPLFVTIYFFKP